MKFVYLDTELRGNLGHHATSCRNMIGEARRRGFETAVFGNIGMDFQLAAELSAHPLFRFGVYQGFYPEANGRPDPICHWLRDFELVWRNTLIDLAQVPTDGTIYWVNSVRAAQLMAVIHWLRERPEISANTVVEFGTWPGLRFANGQWTVPEPSQDPRPFLYRYSALALENEQRLKLATFDVISSTVYQQLMGVGFHSLPLPLAPVTNCRNRVGKRPVTVSILGHQRPDKGYQLVPEFIEILLKRHSDIRLLVHNGCPDLMPVERDRMRYLAATDNRITLDERVADPELWRDLLEQSDLIVCPYDPRIFLTGYSAVASESIANAIPMVVPAQTTLEHIMQQFGCPGLSFQAFTSQSVADATSIVLAQYDEFAHRAFLASQAWSNVHGPKRLFDALLKFTGVAANTMEAYDRQQAPLVTI